MARQTNVVLKDNGDGTANLLVGGFGQDYPYAAFFDRGQDQAHIKNNVRLAFLIGNYGQPNSVEFRNGVNGGSGVGQAPGLQGKDAKYTISDISLMDDVSQTYSVTFKTEAGTTFGIQASVDDLTSDFTGTPTPNMFIDNIIAFLRVGGFSSLTPAAILAVNKRLFWY